MKYMEPERPFTCTQMARYLGVPPAWLRSEAKRGNLPHVRAGTTLLFDRETIERILSERAKSKGAARG